jgi:hypothetical protein
VCIVLFMSNKSACAMLKFDAKVSRLRTDDVLQPTSHFYGL